MENNFFLPTNQPTAEKRNGCCTETLIGTQSSHLTGRQLETMRQELHSPRQIN